MTIAWLARPERIRHQRRLRALALACFSLISLPSCNVIDAAIGRHARVDEMVPGTNVASGELGCWLTIVVRDLPEDLDPTGMRVRFSSVALERPAEFDWAFIADHDVTAKGAKFGSGYTPNSDTSPEAAPPIGQPIKARFPLRAKEMIEEAPNPLFLHVELLWDDRSQHSAKSTIEHVYAHTKDGFL